MKTIALGNRLARDLDEKSVIDLTADVLLELADAINAGLQKLHALAPYQSKTTTGGIFLSAPETMLIGVIQGSTQIIGSTFGISHFYRTLRIVGDTIDNQIIGPAELLHPYAGMTGTASATAYCDAVAMTEPYDEMIGDPRILETDTKLTHLAGLFRTTRKQVARPCAYHIEENARNRNSVAPSVIRFDSLPDQVYRLEAKFTLAPTYIGFTDMIDPAAFIPLRTEYIEVYLIPIARGILTNSGLWKNPETKAQARNDAETAEKKYELLVPRTIATPNNRVGTRSGF